MARDVHPSPLGGRDDRFTVFEMGVFDEMMEEADRLGDDTLEALRELAVALRDSQVGLTEAAGKVDDKDVVRLLYRLAGERATMEHRLNHYLHANQQTPSDSTSWIGELRSVWSRIRAALGQGDATVVLTEVERGEAMIVTHYRKLLPRIAGSPLNAMLLEQFARIKDGHDAVVSLRARKSQRVEA